MAYRIKISNPGNHFSNPLLKLKGQIYPTEERALNAICDALYAVIDGETGYERLDRADFTEDEYHEACEALIHGDGSATEDGVTATVEEVGTLYVCDRDGNNCEPVNIEDEPILYEDVLAEYGANMEPGYTLRKPTADDDCSAAVNFVAEEDETGTVASYYRFII